MENEQAQMNTEELDRRIKEVFLKRLAELYAAGKLSDRDYRRLQRASIEDIRVLQELPETVLDIGAIVRHGLKRR